MAKLRVLVVGRSSPGWADAAVKDYARRLDRLGGIEERAVKPERFTGDVEAVRAAEAARLLAAVGPRDRLVALDERGEDLDTHAFAALVTDGVAQGTGLVFALGGPYGHGEAVRSRADRVVRLSSLVLNHEVARVLLFEQLYRAATLREGLPYHH
ncbi:MAG: 23S rRNA (pseudouridine(1915)-N(3))-methyltransferase RlmH [Alphaproteobacteria bacterium]|nr:23S rRNA (pseudouridine(1915)-N(3))-methyltransferase RlmH [Alphaproteobacteria bacterium]